MTHCQSWRHCKLRIPASCPVSLFRRPNGSQRNMKVGKRVYYNSPIEKSQEAMPEQELLHFVWNHLFRANVIIAGVSNVLKNQPLKLVSHHKKFSSQEAMLENTHEVCHFGVKDASTFTFIWLLPNLNHLQMCENIFVFVIACWWNGGWQPNWRLVMTQEKLESFSSTWSELVCLSYVCLYYLIWQFVWVWVISFSHLPALGKCSSISSRQQTPETPSGPGCRSLASLL